MTDGPQEARGPLAGYRVLDLSTMIAAPFGAALLADFGADVIKVELPEGGDTLRALPPMYAGRSMYWAMLGRNKRSVTMDMRTPRGRDLLLKLVQHADVVIENFRPGTLEKWGLGYEELKAANPDVVLVRLSGYGQTGPYRDKAGFGTPATAIGGLTNLLGYPDRPPVAIPIALTDYLAGLFGAFSAVMALLERERNRSGGQWVDVSLYESVFRLLELLVPAYGKNGEIRERNGTNTGTTAPVGVFGTVDERWIVLSCSNQRIWLRMIEAMGHPEWQDDPRFGTVAERVENRNALDDLVEAWFRARTLAEAQAIMDEAGVPVCPVYSIADIFEDPHYRAREDIIWPEDPHIGPVPMPNVLPIFSRTPGAVRWTGPDLGAHNAEVYGDLLGLSPEELERLRQERVV